VYEFLIELTVICYFHKGIRLWLQEGMQMSREKIAGKFDGYSEAWSKSTFEMKSIRELMRLTEEFEEKKMNR
jgi:hypothetical protein